MSPKRASDALSLSGRVLRVLIVINACMGLLILTLLVATVVAQEPVMRALGFPVAPQETTLILGARLIMVFGIAAVPITHLVLTWLLSIVETVRTGEPFAEENAVRLKRIAWAVLALEVLHLVIAGVATGISTPEAPLDIAWDFSVARWLAVLLLFVLAGVFETGARLRADLEGTV